MIRKYLTLEIFLASSFYPGRSEAVVSNSSIHFSLKNEGFSDNEYGDTEVESEEDWLSVPPPPEPNASKNSRATYALAIKISTFSLFSFKCLTASFVATGLEGPHGSPS